MVAASFKRSGSDFKKPAADIVARAFGNGGTPLPPDTEQRRPHALMGEIDYTGRLTDEQEATFWSDASNAYAVQVELRA